jgi:hypothetical protein
MMIKKWILVVIVLSLEGMLFLSGCVSQQPSSNPAATPDLTNQHNPETATFTAYPAITRLHTHPGSWALQQWGDSAIVP